MVGEATSQLHDDPTVPQPRGFTHDECEWRFFAPLRKDLLLASTQRRPYAGPMLPYENLDAFKTCHELTLRVYRVVDQIGERDPELCAQLWSAALFASSRIARGAAFGNRRMFVVCLERTLAALSEISYHLGVARVINLVSEEDHRELESLRGRAAFYTMKLLTSLISDPGRGSPPPGGDG